jgi:hypothetical protein
MMMIIIISQSICLSSIPFISFRHDMTRVYLINKQVDTSYRINIPNIRYSSSSIINSTYSSSNTHLNIAPHRFRNSLRLYALLVFS